MFLSILCFSQANLPIQFEADTSDIILTDFAGAASSFVVDPTDSSNNVAQTIKTAAAESFAGTFFDLASPVPFTSSSTMMSVRVWSPDANTPVRLKLENAANGAESVETEVNTTMAGAWETLTFDFTNNVAGTPAFDPNGTYDKVVVFFNFGTTGAVAGEKTYFWDDLDFISGGPAPFNLPVTFEADTASFNFIDFAGAVSSFVVDPTDPTNNVAQTIKTAGAESFAGTILGDGFASPIPFTSTSTTMTLRVWSPDANTPVRLKVENAANGAESVETEINTTMAGAWETLTFDFTNNVAGTPAFDPNGTYDKAVVFFNFGTTGAVAGEKTYFWDDLAFVMTGPSLPSLPITFEADTALITFIDFGGAASSFVVDPTDPTNNVAQTIRSDVAETFAGSVVGDGLASPIPFTPGQTTMTMRVWSPEAGIPVRLKVENAANNTESVETESLTTVAMQWETLEFDFSNEAMGTAAINFAFTYDKVVAFFNFGATGAMAGEQTFYWDDIDFVIGGPMLPNLPVRFEGDTALFDLVDFGGAASSVIVDPTDPTNNVAQTIRTDVAETFAGTVIGDGLATPVPFMAGSTTMSMRVWSPLAGLPVRMKVENAANGAESVETEAVTTVAMQWETLEFDFSNEAMGTQPLNLALTYDKVVVFFNFGVTGADAGEQIFFWDDVEFVMVTPDPFELPVLFEADTANFIFIDFAGNATSVVVDPTDPTNNVAQTVRSDGAMTFAGTVLGVDGFTTPIPLTMTDSKMNIRVWSPEAGIPVRLKVENSINGAESVETQMLTTVAMTWETIEFDFLNEVDGTPAFDPGATYDKVVIFFNFGTTGADAGEQTFFWDDVKFGEANSGVNVLSAADHDIMMYPVPVMENLNVELPETMSEQSIIRVYNLQGKLVLLQETQGRAVQIPMATYVGGTYTITIENQDKFFTQKILIVK